MARRLINTRFCMDYVPPKLMPRIIGRIGIQPALIQINRVTSNY